MTTTQIEALASSGGQAPADYPLQTILRKELIPEFLLDIQNVVGDTYWKRKMWTQVVTANLRYYSLPSDFDQFEEIRWVDSSGDVSDPFDYIGDDPTKVITAENETDVGEPSAYYVKETGVAGTPFRLYLDCPPEEAGTLSGRYLWTLVFSDETSEVDLDDYIPEQFQFPLVKLLRSRIYADRYGIEDGRADRQKALYNEDIQKLIVRKESAHAQRPVFVR